MSSDPWPRDDTPPPASGGFDVRAHTTIAFLFSSAMLVMISLFVPGYVRSSWLPLFVGVGLCCLAIAGVTLYRGYLSGAMSLTIIFGADLFIVIAALLLTDRSGGRLVAALLTLPTMFISLFMGWRWLALQACVALSCGGFVLGITGDRLGVVSVQIAIVLVSAICPAVIVLLLRDQLDDALGRAHLAATTDPLTGLYNRRGLDAQVRRIWARAGRSGGTVGVLVADVDHFKHVNDKHGHAVGDTVLRQIAAAARTCVRADDLVVRLGGEEVAVVGVAEPQSGGGDHFEALAERFRAVVEEVGRPWAVTVSIGVAWRRPGIHDDPAERLWMLIDEADDRMYEAKRGGRNQVVSR